ncbi:DUF5133 domain-containing protein [Streptomyces sp. NPDC093801]|uniref:DUF5133 domain-containing protein n=1 Tax=Streptomyces sp. NPDC093801 TaxID=3155203 RepID=UPI00344F1BEE
MAPPGDPPSPALPAEVAPARGGPPGEGPTHTWAVGLLMAAAPCSVREAKQILLGAAELARVTAVEVAAAMVAGTLGMPMPVRIERALRRSLEAARGPVRPGTVQAVGILPSRLRTEEVLSRLRGCQARLAAAPTDPGTLRAMDDVAYTLCVLMGRPSTHQAVLAAEEHLSAAAE